MKPGIFVTGTDTGCGKTFASVALIAAWRRRGLRVAGFKPVAAGAEPVDGILHNDDALALRAASGRRDDYALVNPYCFAPAIAPHIAAAEAGVEIDREPVLSAWQRLRADSDLVLAEGAGGWLVPLGPQLDTQDLVAWLDVPVLMVVGLRLGCLNHARLTEQAILHASLPLVGWLGSVLDPEMPRLRDNVVALRQRLQTPCLGLLDSEASADGYRNMAARVLRALL